MGHSLNRREFIQLFVLMQIADDYENAEHLWSVVERDSSKCGFQISKSEVTGGLAALIDSGLARAYRLSGTGAVQALDGVPQLEDVEDFNMYFYATPKGKALVSFNRDWWPFDDLGNVRNDWRPPDQ